MSGFKAVSLFPFAYLVTTRIRSMRDFAYLVATSWLPAIWLLWRLTDLGLGQSIWAFALGYLAFVSIYEIGYLINDAWEAGRSGNGRRRVDFAISTPYLVAFAVIRVACWAAIGIWTGWIQIPAWLVGFAILIATIGQHNLVQSKGFRIASFYELAVMRFILPIVGSLPSSALAPPIIAAMLLYAFPRLLAYMDSKDVLQLEQRTDPTFGFLLLLSLSPLIALIAYLLDMRVLAELMFYYLAILALWWAIASPGDASIKR